MQHSTRLVAVANAAMHGIHWGQVLRQQRVEQKGDAELFGFGPLTPRRVEELWNGFKQLAKLPPARVVAWTSGKDDAEVERLTTLLNADPIPSSERLPVNLLIAYVKRRLSGPEEFF